MKRMISVFTVLYVTVLCVYAWIPDDFYLNNAPLPVPSDKEIKILPSTLRIVLTAGEAEEIYADVVSEGARVPELSWRLSGQTGAAEIYPHGKTCTILGVSKGEETLVVSCGGATVSIPVSVRKPPETSVRSFEYEGEPSAEKAVAEKMYRTVVRVLITLGALLCFGAVIYIINRRLSKGK